MKTIKYVVVIVVVVVVVVDFSYHSTNSYYFFLFPYQGLSMVLFDNPAVKCHLVCT